MTAIGRVFERLGPSFRQQAFVVDDLELAKSSMEQSFGCRRWFQFESTTPWKLHGRTVQCDLGLAFSRSANIMIELIQPVRGEGLHFDLLGDRGPGPHHLGFFIENLDQLAAASADDGYPPVMSGEMGNARFCYLDTVDEIGLYLELIEDPDQMMRRMMPWLYDPISPS